MSYQHGLEILGAISSQRSLGKGGSSRQAAPSRSVAQRDPFSRTQTVTTSGRPGRPPLPPAPAPGPAPLPSWGAPAPAPAPPLPAPPVPGFLPVMPVIPVADTVYIPVTSSDVLPSDGSFAYDDEVVPESDSASEAEAVRRFREEGVDPFEESAALEDEEMLGADVGVPVQMLLSKIRGANPLPVDVAKKLVVSSIKTLGEANRLDKPSWIKSFFTDESTEGAQSRRNKLAYKIQNLGYKIPQSGVVAEPLANDIRESSVQAYIEMNSVAERVASEEANTVWRNTSEAAMDALRATAQGAKEAYRAASDAVKSVVSRKPAAAAAPAMAAAAPADSYYSDPAADAEKKGVPNWVYYTGGGVALLGLGFVGYKLIRR